MALRTKYTPAPPSSILLDKKWKQHDYLLHQYRLHAINGVPVQKPIFNEASNKIWSPPQQRHASAKQQATRSAVVMPRAQTSRKRPLTSRERLNPLKESPYTVKKNNFMKQRPTTSKEKQSQIKNVAKEARPVTLRPVTSKPRAFTARQRPLTSKAQHQFGQNSARMNRSRPHTSKEFPKNDLEKNQRVKVLAFKPKLSEYSRENMNKHFERHQYYRNHILNRNKIVQRPLTPSESDSDTYSEFFESSSENGSSNVPSPAPSPTPSPPAEEERQMTPLFMEENMKVEESRTPTPVRILNKELPPLEDYIPPSHIYKVAKNASDSSDTGDEEPVCILKDGKPGRYKKKNGKYVLVDEEKRKERLKKKAAKLKMEAKLNNDNEDNRDSENEITYREVRYIDYQNAESSDDENNNPNEEKLFIVNDLEKKAREKKEQDSTSEVKEVEEKTIRKIYYEMGEGDTESEGQEMDTKADTESDKDEMKDPVEKFKEKFSNLRKDTPEDFDAKKHYDSGSDLDEFGRRRDRARPSSSMYDYLPPLRPDPVIDGGDVNRCKIRLLRDAVNIKESLSNNEGVCLETAVNIIISYNCDNRRWLRKIYRDEYLQSLLLDLRKTLPADIASVISYMMIPICEFDAMCLWDALKGLHKDPEVLCEILCTRNNEELAAIREAYYLRYNEELIDHIEDETIGIFQRILMKLATGQRLEDAAFSKAEAAKEARAISALLEVKGENLHKKLIEIFTKWPVESLRLVLTEYSKFKGYDMDVDIVKVLQGNFSRCIITLMHYIQNPPNYFVQKLHNTHFKGVDDDKSLCRILISRSESDVEMIKQLFLLRYDMELFDYIAQICHSPLKGLVLRLIAGNTVNGEVNGVMLPPLFPADDDFNLIERLTLPASVQTVLRKTKIVSKFVKLLFMRRERVRQGSESSDDSPEEFELEAEQGEEEDEDEDNAPAIIDSEEEAEIAAKEAQRELRNGLKNISFAENVEVAAEGEFRSVFQDVSFAAASRGILKNTDAESEDEDEKQEQALDLDDELGQQNQNGPKMTQLNGPVLDPTFTGRGENKFSARLKIGKKSKKKFFHGTVKGIPMVSFNALKDAQAIGKAMLQKNRNVEGILQFMATRNNAQRQLIIREFFRRYRRDLVDDLRTLAPLHEEVTLSLLLSREIYDSASLYAAVSNADPQHTIDVFIEILCSRQNDEIAIIKRAFNGIFSMDLHEEIAKITYGPFRTLLCAIADCERDEGDILDENLAKKDAQALYEAVIKKRNIRDYNTFIEIFGTRTFPHIEAVCDNFSKISQVDILEILDETLEREFLEGVTAIICNVRDASMYFCERIYRSVCYEEPDYSMLIRCIISRAEIDLQLIKSTFRQTYGRTVYNLIDKDCEFKSKKILLNVVKK